MTNPGAVEWFKKLLQENLDLGIDLFKTDFGEDIPLDSFNHAGISGKKIRNKYAFLYNKAVFEISEKHFGKGNALVWSRSAWAGSQQFPTCWAGDPETKFSSMRAVLRGGLSVGLSGIPFWSHDVGGFYGEPNTELYIRWMQFGAFCSHLRCHGRTSRLPWKFSDEALKNAKKYLGIRYRLLPYIAKTAQQAKEGIPFIRPLMLEYYEDFTTHMIDDQFMMGDSILVAPVFTERARERNVYLPYGVWYEYETKKAYTGGRWIKVETPLDYIPLFVKEGAVIQVLDTDIKHIPYGKTLESFTQSVEIWGGEQCEEQISVYSNHNIYRGSVAHDCITSSQLNIFLKVRYVV
jgi:alpha-D-xyloside xylohydrolase